MNVKIAQMIDNLPAWLPRRFIKFAVVGFAGVIVNLTFVGLGMTLFSESGPVAAKAYASALGILVSIFTNFLLNDNWTWKDRDKNKQTNRFIKRLAKYYTASSFAALIQYGIAQLLAQIYFSGTDLTYFGINFNPLSIYLAQFCGIAVGITINFFVNNYWTFRNKIIEQTSENENK